MDNRFNKSWYGDKAQLVDSDNDCVIIDYGCKGKGIITSYNLYDGITLCFLDFYTDEIMPSQKFKSYQLLKRHSVMILFLNYQTDMIQ